MIGQTIGQYTITEQIGRGGMATVYKAFQPTMERYVAIKILPPHVSQNPTFIKRFRQEVKAIARLEHPHILPVYDYGEQEGLLYLVMRYLDSGTLVHHLKKHVDVAKVVGLLGQVAEALDYTHRQNIIHRDIKPGNILIDSHESALLADFGIAKIVAEAQDLTKGHVVGTSTYMSPEQAQGQMLDGRSDIYSLGVISYQAMVGQLPFEAETPDGLRYKHVHEPVPPPHTIKPNISSAMEQVILRALAKNPKDRYHTADEFKQAMHEALKIAEESLTELRPTPAEQEEAASQESSPNQTSVSDSVVLLRKNRLVLSVGGVLVVVVCSLLVLIGAILSNSLAWLSPQETATSERSIIQNNPVTINDSVINAPVEVTNQIVEKLTIQAGDPPEVKARKAEQRNKLIASVILDYQTNIDTRLVLVETALSEDEFEQKLNEVRATVAPSAQDIFAAGYRELITTEKINSLRQEFNSYPLATAPNPLLLDLVAESEADPADVRFFYDQLSEVQAASETLLERLATIAERDPNDQIWQDYDQRRLQLAVDTLQNRSNLAHVAGLTILNDLPAAEADAAATLSTLTRLEPCQMVADGETTNLLADLLAEAETLSAERAALVEEGDKLLDSTLADYAALNEDLTIEPTDTWDIVVGKAISLRQLGRSDDAVAAFTTYEEMFAETDPTATQYAQTARHFTRQFDSLEVVDGAVYIFNVAEDSPAAAGGVEVGDILIDFNGQPIRNVDDLQAALQTMPIGQRINLTILRPDEQNSFQRQTITVTAQDPLGLGFMPI